MTFDLVLCKKGLSRKKQNSANPFHRECKQICNVIPLINLVNKTSQQTHSTSQLHLSFIHFVKTALYISDFNVWITVDCGAGETSFKKIHCS